MYRHKPFTGVGDMLTVDDVAPSMIEIVIVISLITSLDGRNNELRQIFKEVVAHWFDDQRCCLLRWTNYHTCGE